MAIVEKQRPNGEKYYGYLQPEADFLFEQVDMILQTMDTYLSRMPEIKLEDLDIDLCLLSEAYIRVDKRKDYFFIFHQNTNPNEIKKAALLSYWILKFKPFSLKIKDEYIKRKYSKINEAFAMYIIYSAIREEIYTKSQKENKLEKKFDVSNEYNKKLMYAFKFWDLSKESLILVAESLCESMHLLN